jgi:hypothetical protein
MVWKRTIVVLLALALVLSVLAMLKTYYVRSGATGELVWASDEAYIFGGEFQYGYSSSWLGFLAGLVREIFPFGAPSPEKKHFRVTVLHITPDATQSYSVDDFQIGSPPFVVGQNIYLSNILVKSEPMVWTGTRFEPMTPAEKKDVLDATDKGEGSGSPTSGVTGRWSTRLLDFVSPGEDSAITIELRGIPLRVLAHSGYIDHEAYIDVSRPGQASQRIWHLNEKPERVNRATYDRIFASEVK